MKRSIGINQKPLKAHLVASQHAGKLLLVGLVGVVWHNWRLWQRDKELVSQKAPSLPALERWIKPFGPRKPFGRKKPSGRPELPQVSLLVAAWNEAEHIDQHIQSFLALRYPNKELVLCAGGKDGTYELAKRYAGPQVKVFEQQAGEGKQRALQRCFPHTTGEIIFLTDADCELDDEPFERTLYPVATGIEEVSTGGSRPYPELLKDPLVVAKAASDLRVYSEVHADPYWPGLLGRNCAISRLLLEKTQGLAVPAPTGTDYVLAKTLVQSGVRIRQVRESQIKTEYPTQIKQYIRQQRRWLRNVALHGRRFCLMQDLYNSLFMSLMGLTMLIWPVIT